MRRLSGARVLPVELWSRSFNCLELSTLLLCAHTCKHWRSIAFADPLFWRDLVIEDLSSYTLNWAQARLDHGGAYVDIKIDYRVVDGLVRSRLIPILRAAIPRARHLIIRIESLYRLDVEDALCEKAPRLEVLVLLYASDPPDLHLAMPFGYQKSILADLPGRLYSVHLNNIILPSVPTKAFINVTEVWFNHDLETVQDEFPCYLWDFFPNMTCLRMSGGDCYFANAPLPRKIVDAFARLTFFDMKFKESSLAGFFKHLPIHSVSEVFVFCADEDTVYSTLEPLRSPFRMALSPLVQHGKVFPAFHITMRGSGATSELVRHLGEPLSDYYPGSEITNALLQNDELCEQLSDLTIHTTLWKKLNPWLPSLVSLPKLIVIIDEDMPDPISLPKEPLSCPAITTLVLQTRLEFVYVVAQDLIAFSDRITGSKIALELRRVLVAGGHEPLAAHFESILYSNDRL